MTGTQYSLKECINDIYRGKIRYKEVTEHDQGHSVTEWQSSDSNQFFSISGVSTVFHKGTEST